MKNVRIRKEGNDYLLYFPSERFTTTVNKLGAEISEMFLNQEMSKKQIVEELSKKYSNVPKDVIENDIIDFIDSLYERITHSNVNLAEQRQLDFPLGAEVEITTGCNLRCRHCFQGSYCENFMSFEKFKSIIDILVNNNVYELNLVGGEVFHHPDAMKMIEYADKKEMLITIVTNATLITDEQIKNLSKIKNLFILISLDGNEKVHDYIRGKGMYDITINTAKKIKNMNINVEFLYTLNAVNISIFEEVVEFSRNLDIPINFNLFKPFNKKNHKDLQITPKQYFETIERLLYLRVREGYKIGVSNASIVAYALGLPDKNECTASLSGVVINTKGYMLTCPYLVESGYYDEKDLPKFDENFLEVWRHGEFFNKFRNSGLKNCQACSYIYTGDVKGRDPFGIENYKEYCTYKEE